jgi:putative transposase
MVSLAERRRSADYLEQTYAVSERRVCRVVGITRSTKRRSPGRTEEVKLIGRIHELSEQYPRFGYRKVFVLMRNEGWKIGRERLRLLRRREGLRVPQKRPKRRRRGSSTTNPQSAKHPNHVWSYDFVSDQTSDGRTIRFLTVIDEYTRRALWIECARHLTSYDVVRVLEQLVELHGHPTMVKSDNGPEFVARKVQLWMEERGIGARFIDPGSPWQNGHNESFNGVFRDGCLNRWLFESIREARETTESWLQEYNQVRPHGSLGGLAPFMFFKHGKPQDREAA